MVNGDLAAAAEYEIPPREAWDSQAFVEAALTMHGDPEVPGGSDALGLLLNVEPMWGAPDQLWSWTPSFLFLQSALGALPDSQGSFAALRSPQALAIAETFYDLATTYGLAEDAERDRNPIWYRLHPGQNCHARHVPRRPRVRLDDPPHGARQRPLPLPPLWRQRPARQRLVDDGHLAPAPRNPRSPTTPSVPLTATPSASPTCPPSD